MLTAFPSDKLFAGGDRRSTKSRRAGVLFACALAGVLYMLAAPAALAQTTSSATLRGTVKDPTGAVVRDATVTLTNKQRGDQRQAKTSDDGTYSFTSVDPGAYTLRVEAGGFKVSEQTNLSLAPSETRGLDVSLEVGGATETVTVSAASESTIQTETGERSNTITSAQIDNLSVIGRSSLELLRTLPGVVAPEQNDLDVVGFGSGGNASANYTVNGIRGVNNNVSIDGSRVVDIGSNNGTIITPNNDMVQEVTVKSSNYAAEYGSGGVQITATTKGGAREFHGELYDYIRPRQLAANDRSNTIVGNPRPKSSFQYPGGQVGGPVLLPFTKFNRERDKLFFFYGLEFQRQQVAFDPRFGVVPTAAERAGDFSHSTSSFGSVGNTPLICPPDTFNFSPCSTPTTNLTGSANPIGVALLNLYPLPNFTPAAGSAQARFNYAISPVAPANRIDQKLRFDYNITNNTKAYLRLARESESANSPYGIWWGPSNYELPSQVQGTNLGRSAALNVTSVINPTMTNEVVFSASKLKLNYDFEDPSKLTKASLGIQNLVLPFRTSTPYAPLALISWDVGTQLWEPGNLPLFAHNDSYSVNDTLSKVTGNHTMKFGALIERADKFQNTNGTPEGQIEFEAGNQPRTTGNAFANLYTGRINGITQTSDFPNGNFRFWNFETFAQDSWKLRPNVTVEYGLRMSYFPNNYETNGLAVAFDIRRYRRGAGAFIGGDPNKPNGYVLAKNGDIPKGILDNPAPRFAPRLNVAWDVFGDASTVIRGGAGVFYNRVQGNYEYNILSQPPNALSTAADAWSVPNNDLTLSNLGTINPLTRLQGFAVSSKDVANPDSYKVPQTITTSLSVARRLPYQNVLEVAYVGTFGRHLPQTQSLNYVFPGTLPATLGNANLSNPIQRAAVANNAAAFTQLLPYPDFSQVTLQEFVGTSNYHSLQATLNRQLGKRLQYFLTYTFSKALGTTSTNETGGSEVDPVNARRNYGILPYDRTHIFNASYNYNFPDLARGGFRNWFTRGVFNGWQMSGITTFESGRRINLNLTGAIIGNPAYLSYFGTNAFTSSSSGTAAAITPVLSVNPQTGAQGVGQRYLDLSAISVPGFGTSGAYQQPFYVRSPRRSNWDVTFFKNFNFTETKKLQFRVGLFNVFNQAFPNTDLGDIDLVLETECIRQVAAGVPNGTGLTDQPMCDPTGGYRFTQRTINNFGRIVSKHGHRRTELAFKFYF
jgi:Carboxypeptidase regulatory-like domain/TonB-dependent Receptor Plug Domain